MKETLDEKSRDALVQYRLDRADETMKEAEILAKESHFNAAVNRGHLHNHVGLTENFDQSENEEFLVNDSP